MPWDAASAPRFTKSARSQASREKWAAVADAVLAKTGDEGQAIRIANASVNHDPMEKLKKAMVHGR